MRVVATIFEVRKELNMQLAVLNGQLWNGEPAEIPCLVFSSLEKGMDHCKKLFGFDPAELREGEDDGIVGYRWAIESKNKGEDYITDPAIQKVAKELYRDYQFDSVFAFDLIVTEEGTPFVSWLS